MANRAQVAPRVDAHPFFALHARYLIAPGAYQGALKLDAACLLSASRATVQAILAGEPDPDNVRDVLLGVSYQLTMVESLLSALEVAP